MVICRQIFDQTWPTNISNQPHSAKNNRSFWLLVWIGWPSEILGAPLASSLFVPLTVVDKRGFVDKTRARLDRNMNSLQNDMHSLSCWLGSIHWTNGNFLSFFAVLDILHILSIYFKRSKSFAVHFGMFSKFKFQICWGKNEAYWGKLLFFNMFW